VHRDEKWCIDQKFDLSAGNFLRIAVQDTGAGIPHEHMKHIFEPFFTTKPVGKGTGLGLASVYGAMKNHRGAVMVESAIGKGTIFTLHLPLLKTGALGGAGAAPARAVAQSVSAARILLVDDEDVVVKMTETLLKKMGHAVITARDGKSAIELFERERAAIDLVLLDLVMPVMSGQETFGRLRQIDPCLQIILISGYSKDGIAQGLLDKGAAGFLQKPFRCDELAATVSDVLHRRRPP
jgi:CheY-like chemotaxis protein